MSIIEKSELEIISEDKDNAPSPQNLWNITGKYKSKDEKYWLEIISQDKNNSSFYAKFYFSLVPGAKIEYIIKSTYIHWHNVQHLVLITFHAIRLGKTDENKDYFTNKCFTGYIGTETMTLRGVSFNAIGMRTSFDYEEPILYRTR